LWSIQYEDTPEEFCQGKSPLGKILPGKKYIPELENGGKNSVPSGFGRGKRKFGARNGIIFWLTFLSMTR
jgi:hypothetical protein